MSRRDDLRKQIDNHRRRLQKLEEQQALYGLDTLSHVLIEIEDIKAKIEALQGELKALEERGVEAEPKIPPIAPAPRTIPLQRPLRATHFTGREKELAQLMADLQPGRVVTLCGPGGVGKTALAAEAIWTLPALGTQAQVAPGDAPPERFPDGILFHSFYTQPQATLALEAIARAYGEEPRPSPRDAAQRALAGRRPLLVLDEAENADDLRVVLEVAGGCGVLVTSRRRYDAPAHAARRDVAPLPNPEAVQLLQAWGGDQAADVDAARRICELVGGLPLAVRLAGRYLAQREGEAADYLIWLEETPLTALDHGERQWDGVSLLLARSLGQVSMEARRALGVVGILALAPFSRDAVAAAMDISPREASRALGELVDYGLLLWDKQRYQPSHALVHTYARRRLAPPVEVIERLAAHYDSLAREQRELGLAGYAVLDAERPHLMATLAGCIAQKHWEGTRNLVWAIENYLNLQGCWVERVIALDVGLTATRALGRRYDEGAFLSNLGNAYYSLGQVERAIEYHEQALAIFREIGDQRGKGAELGNLSLAYRALGQVEPTIEYYQQALVIHQEIGDRRGEGVDLGSLGNAYRDLGQLEQAIEYYEGALAIHQEIGERRGEGIDLGNLGNAYRALGLTEQAIEYYEGALAIAREIGDRRGEGADLGDLGLAYRDLGLTERAIEYYEGALAIAREIGDRRGEGADLGNLGLAYRALGQVEQAIEYHEQALAISREIGDRRGEGADLGNLGVAYHSLGQVERAIEYYEGALAIAREIGDQRGEGADLGNLGLAYRALGQVERARDCLEQALAIFEEIRSPDAEWARERLAELEEEE
jgi:tetratricopeptide (TPR) repeat protein